ncbi:MAG TPA: ATP-dependent helicase HrpB [Paenibacillus sp.]|uniref:ATP-dependent helicase HrpB n=1 Tax=Paenibacillus sp. TaxID=58172 RepID=UPI002BE2E23D|nr:ATP-dependent helicase HrpB [Paenibacillus sp.]HUC91259.1 ATP-dependent helicase HrpB [Paenibacillus sp.]
MPALPIEAVLPQLADALREGAGAVLVAAPGAGKTTRVPLALLDEPWMRGKRMLMLEPRRMAARAAAHYMADMLGEKAGGTVGYRVRMDSRVGPRTRIEVITEGILTRMLQDDPGLTDVGLVIFDEFHERSLHADLGLALCLESRQMLRDDLRLLVMSATIEAEPVAALLGGATVVVSEGRQYPVETRFFPRQSAEERLESHTVRAVKHALSAEVGDLLVFLPGEGEIRRVQRLLGRLDDAVVLPLYGALPQAEQDRALAAEETGRRKVVLATSIAETSLTVQSVRIVIDAGLMRVPRFSPRTGMTRLETVAVSRASADQRRGRAGRLAPGVCYRLWSEAFDAGLAPSGKPEIAETDLAPTVLELAAWGAPDPRELRFLDMPPEPAFKQALELLKLLGAVDSDGRVTAHGRRMAGAGVHPRLAHMVLRAEPLGLGGLACELAALLGERDVLCWPTADAAEADVTLRLQALRAVAPSASAAEDRWSVGAAEVAAAGARAALAEAALLKRTFGLPAGVSDGCDDDRSGLLLAFAYPDRIGMKRKTGGSGTVGVGGGGRGADISGGGVGASSGGGGAYQLSGGRGAVLPRLQPLSGADFIVAAELDDAGTDSRIRLAAAVELAELERHMADRFIEERSVFWDREAQAVRARHYVRLGALTIKETMGVKPSPEELAHALLGAVRQEGLGVLPWTKTAKQLLARLAFLHRLDEGWPDVSEDALLASLEDWLLPHLHGMKGQGDFQRLNMVGVLESLLPWDKRRQLDEEAPTAITVPSGSRIAVDYGDPEAPVLSVKLQEMFGLHRTPTVGFGRVPLTLHLLSPAQRPVQVTRDLAGFWSSTYFDVKKDLKGRYPKHYWPDDPTAATPTNRVRPRP